MSDLTEFIRACITEREAEAQALLDDLTNQVEEAGYQADERGPFTPQRQLAAELWAQYAGQSRWRNFARGQHIARLADPTIALAECQAKRTLLELSEHGCGDDYERVQKALAATFADHPDYRERWRL